VFVSNFGGLFMIRSYNKMQGTQILAVDGEIGMLKDVYFDDRNWKVQYFIVELGPWFSGKDVLIPPALVSPFDGISLKVQLTKKELQTSSHDDSLLPFPLLQRYYERNFQSFVGSNGCFMGPGPIVVPPIQINVKNAIWDDPHLWSCNNVSRYEIIARDGDVGTNQDVLIDDNRWLVPFIVAAINCPGHLQEKLYNPQIIEDIEWALEVVNISETKDKVFAMPCFEASKHLDISYETIVGEMRYP
jgi:hypothetical protein